MRAMKWAFAWAKTGHRVGIAAMSDQPAISPAGTERQTIVDTAGQPPPKLKVSPDDIAIELKRIVRKGLPIDLPRAGTVLPNLRSVVARSVHPDDLVSRLDALNQLLVRFLVELGDDETGQAMRVLFAIAKGSKGTNLMQRRAGASAALGKDPDHFRKHLEGPMIYELAVTIHRDLLRYKSRAKRAPESLEPTGDTPSLNETHFTHQEELVSRIWEKVYALRAEYIAVGRRERAGNPGAMALEIEEHRQMAKVEESALRALIAEYIDIYGEGLIRHGDNEYALKSWISGLSSGCVR